MEEQRLQTAKPILKRNSSRYNNMWPQITLQSHSNKQQDGTDIKTDRWTNTTKDPFMHTDTAIHTGKKSLFNKFCRKTDFLVSFGNTTKNSTDVQMDHMAILHFIFWETVPLTSQRLHKFMVHQQYIKCPLSHPHQHLVSLFTW